MPQSIPQIAEISVSYKPNQTISKRISTSRDAFEVFKTYITVLYHLIIAGDKDCYYSFADEGEM